MLPIGFKNRQVHIILTKMQVNVLQKNGREFAQENYTDSMFLLKRGTKVKFSRAETRTANFVVNKNIIPNYNQQDAKFFYFFLQKLYMFQEVPLPIIRST